jgi:flagellar FliJ protein
MAGFSFELDGVLRQRKNVERVAQQRLAEATKVMVELQENLRRLDEGVKAISQDVRDNHLTGVIDVNFITAHRRYLLGMERRAMELAKQIAEAQAKVRQTQEMLVAASRERKTIEKLRDRQFDRWKSEQTRRENDQLDEAGMQIAYSNLKETFDGSNN